MTFMRRFREALRRRSTSAKSKTTTTDAQSPASIEAPRKAISAAAQTVFRTPELLESILIHLGQDEILLTQRVCKSFKEIVSQSLPLQRMLYLSPALKVDERIPVDNHWLKARFPDLGIYLLQGNPRWRPKFVRALGASDFDRAGTAFFASVPNASWRDMLLTQPPVKEVVVYASMDGSSSRRSSSATANTKRISSIAEVSALQVPTQEELRQASVLVRNTTGITMGMLLDASIEANKRGYAAARKRDARRTDSGYISVEEIIIDHFEVAVLQLTLPR